MQSQHISQRKKNLAATMTLQDYLAPKYPLTRLDNFVQEQHTKLADLVGRLEPENLPVINSFVVEPSRIDALFDVYHQLNKRAAQEKNHADHYALALPLLRPLAPFTEDEVRFAFHQLYFVKTSPTLGLASSCSTILSILVSLCPAQSLTITPQTEQTGFGDDFEMPEQCIGKWYKPNFTYPKINSKRTLIANGTVYAACCRVAGGIVHIKGNAEGISNSQRGGEVIVDGRN